MLRFLLNLCHRPAIRFGLARDPRSRQRTASFASFLAQNNHHPLEAHRHTKVLRGRKLMRHALLAALASGLAWVAVESAKALSSF